MGSECDELRERVRQLEAQLFEEVTLRHEQLVRDRFKLEPGQAWTVMRLYAAKGRALNKYWLMDNRPYKPRKMDEFDRDEESVLRVHVHYVKKKIGADAIGRRKGAGYYMTDVGLERVKGVLNG
jgi:DNA-binding response OmpR family regulator